MVNVIRMQLLRLAGRFADEPYCVRELAAELLADLAGEYGRGIADGTLLRSRWSAARRQGAN